jgi:hypothetical protein
MSYAPESTEFSPRPAPLRDAFQTEKGVGGNWALPGSVPLSRDPVAPDQVVGRVEIEEREHAGIDSQVLSLFHVPDPKLVEKRRYGQETSLNSVSHLRLTGPGIDGVKGLDHATGQPRDDSIVTLGHFEHTGEQGGVQKGHVTRDHNTQRTFGGQQTGVDTAKRSFARIRVGNHRGHVSNRDIRLLPRRDDNDLTGNRPEDTEDPFDHGTATDQSQGLALYPAKSALLATIENDRRGLQPGLLIGSTANPDRPPQGDLRSYSGAHEPHASGIVSPERFHLPAQLRCS